MNRFLKPILAIFIINIAILIALTIITWLISQFTGVNIFSSESGIYGLFIWSLILGFTSAFVSLFISRWMVKFLYKIDIVKSENIHLYNEKIQYLYYKLKQLSEANNIPMPELGIYESSEPNAFATGCGLCGRLIAFSTGIIEIMDKNELDGVLGHEFAHLMNGDMVTTTMLQGFLDTFVIFISRIIAGIVSSRDDEEYNPFIYFITTIILELLFGILVGMILAWYSRIREFAADKDSALKYSNKYNMAQGLEKLKIIAEQGVPIDPHNDELATLKINNFGGKLLNLFSTHPPLDERIKRVLSL